MCVMEGMPFFSSHSGEVDSPVSVLSDDLGTPDKQSDMVIVSSSDPESLSSDSELPKRPSDIPCFFHGKKTYSTNEILQIILGNGHNNKICSKVPVGTKENAVFVIDSSRLRSPEDIRADDLGVWVNNGVRRSFVTCQLSNSQVVSKVNVIAKGDTLPSQYYQLVRSYFYHKQSKDYKRTIFQLFGMLHA